MLAKVEPAISFTRGTAAVDKRIEEEDRRG